MLQRSLHLFRCEGLRAPRSPSLRLGELQSRPYAFAGGFHLAGSVLAGGDSIDDADALRSGSAASALGCVVKAPSTLGDFLRSFRWGRVRQLDRVRR